MAEYKPTAANIISSLGINGLTVNETLPGYVPVLDDNGKLSAKLIPDTGKLFSVKTLSNVVFVDPNTDVEDNRNGSITAPYKSLTEAAKKFKPQFFKKDAVSKPIGFILAPGVYTDSLVSFVSSDSANSTKDLSADELEEALAKAPTDIYLIGIGECSFASGNTLSLEGFAGDKPTVFIQNISVKNLSIADTASVTVIGKTNIVELNCAANGENSDLFIGGDSRVLSSNIDNISYLSEANNVGNTSNVSGVTVHDALNRLGGRKLRVAKVTSDDSGFGIDQTYSYEDVGITDSGDFEYYDLRERDKLFIEGINNLISRGKNIVVDTVTTGSITATTITADKLLMKSIILNGYQLSIDSYGYLVVLDGDAQPPNPPTTLNSLVLLRDTDNGAIFKLGVINGRLYIEDTEDTGSEIVDSLTLTDFTDGSKYDVYINGGKVIIKKTGGVA